MIELSKDNKRLKIYEKLPDFNDNMLEGCEGPYWHSIDNLRGHLLLGYKTLKLKKKGKDIVVAGNKSEIKKLYREIMQSVAYSLS